MKDMEKMEESEFIEENTYQVFHHLEDYMIQHVVENAFRICEQHKRDKITYIKLLESVMARLVCKFVYTCSKFANINNINEYKKIYDNLNKLNEVAAKYIDQFKYDEILTFINKE